MKKRSIILYGLLLPLLMTPAAVYAHETYLLYRGCWFISSDWIWNDEIWIINICGQGESLGVDSALIIAATAFIFAIMGLAWFFAAKGKRKKEKDQNYIY